MSAGQRPDQETTVADDDVYLKKFADFLATQPVASGLAYEDVARAKTRDELGISSLNIILIVSNYLKERTGGTMSIQPVWVSRLNDIAGIASVFREIEEGSRQQTST